MIESLFILQSGGHVDLLTAALSESGLSGLADEFGDEDDESAEFSNQVFMVLI